MMLSTALSEMIDNTECIMFYNTPNSVSLVDDLKTIQKEKNKVTLSPWIYHELSMTSLVRRQKLTRIVPLLENVIEHRAFSEKNELNIEYNIEKYLRELIAISGDELQLWKRNYSILTHKLDGDFIPNISGYEDIHPMDVFYNLLISKK